MIDIIIRKYGIIPVAWMDVHDRHSKLDVVSALLKSWELGHRWSSSQFHTCIGRQSISVQEFVHELISMILQVQRKGRSWCTTPVTSRWKLWSEHKASKRYILTASFVVIFTSSQASNNYQDYVTIEVDVQWEPPDIEAYWCFSLASYFLINYHIISGVVKLTSRLMSVTKNTVLSSYG